MGKKEKKIEVKKDYLLLTKRLTKLKEVSKKLKAKIIKL